ncbi:MAG: addiction module antidote protein [Bradyrhizobium sp.]|uniref:addiction module antidote protein n=1 Tax=Bradyrhizobium sp. TaxID=376 RepID=UPI003C7A4C74
MPAFLMSDMSEKPVKLEIGPQSNRLDIADYLNRAFATRDIIAICRAIGDATRLYNISDIASQAGIERPSVYRAFGGRHLPNFTTVVNILAAMGFQLKVTQRRGKRARLAKHAKLKSSETEG